MDPQRAVGARSLGFAATSLLVVACTGAGAPTRISAPPSRNATFALRSALVVPDAEPTPATPATPPVTTVIVSCQGGALCRETIAPASSADVLEEAKEDCADRGGRLGDGACPRGGVLASCTLSGGAGPIRVFTYEQESASDQADAISTMDDLCDAAGGAFELRAP